MLEWLGEPLFTEEDEGELASNDEWAFRKADHLVSRLPARVGGKDQRTEGEVFDRRTLMGLHKLLAAGVLKSLDFPVSTGKEANVFRGTEPGGGLVAVKIYRVNTATFKHALKYMQGDERFAGVRGDKRQMVSMWAQKEFRNLNRLRNAGLDVPEAIKQHQNILVTEFVGTEDGAVPKLKEFPIADKKEAQAFYDKVSQDYVTAVTKAKLVHADLSEYNILVDQPNSKKPFPRIIDVGQSVLTNHPMSREFLTRDVQVLTAFFKRQGVRVTPEDLHARLGDWQA